MIGLVQLVSEAEVVVAGEIVGQIASGLMVLVAMIRGDTTREVSWMADKLVSLRIFPGGNRSFDQDIRQAGGAILLVSNFTLAGDTGKGRRPSLDAALPAADAEPLFDDLVSLIRSAGVKVETGQFGADMRVSLTNTGPVTFVVDSSRPQLRTLS
jgi:D-tyrosyl-tRNA(Tyr) deacylase